MKLSWDRCLVAVGTTTNNIFRVNHSIEIGGGFFPGNQLFVHSSDSGLDSYDSTSKVHTI